MLIEVRVQADSKKEKVEILEEGKLKVRVREPRKEERANERVIEMLSDYYKKDVKLIRGRHSKRKLFLIE